jgi:hypothetical protein
VAWQSEAVIKYSPGVRATKRSFVPFGRKSKELLSGAVMFQENSEDEASFDTSLTARKICSEHAATVLVSVNP